MNTRREFLQIGALAALGAAAGCKTASRGGFAVNGVRIGVQMYRDGSSNGRRRGTRRSGRSRS